MAQLQFRPRTSTSVPDSRVCEVSKSQRFDDNYEYVTLKHEYSVRIESNVKTMNMYEKGPVLCPFFLLFCNFG